MKDWVLCPGPFKFTNLQIINIYRFVDFYSIEGVQ